MKEYEIKAHRFLKIVSKALVTLTIFTSISCQNIFTEKKSYKNNNSKARIIVTASATTVSRNAINPTLDLSNFTDFKLYASEASKYAHNIIKIKRAVREIGNNDATLSNLNISGGTLSPAFDPATEDYTVTFDEASMTVVPKNPDSMINYYTGIFNDRLSTTN